MTKIQKPYSMIVDFVTGNPIPDIGAEANRQALARYLVQVKGWAKSDLALDVDIHLQIGQEIYRSQLDLVVGLGEKQWMVCRCCAGSMASRDREVIAAARLLAPYQIPVAVVSDGADAIVYDTITSNKLGEGLADIPSKTDALAQLDLMEFKFLPPQRRRREALIFRTYDMENINVRRRLQKP